MYMYICYVTLCIYMYNDTVTVNSYNNTYMYKVNIDKGDSGNDVVIEESEVNVEGKNITISIKTYKCIHCTLRLGTYLERSVASSLPSRSVCEGGACTCTYMYVYVHVCKCLSFLNT